MTPSDVGTTERVDRVFLSYAQADVSLARAIAKSLRQAGITVLDQSNIEAGQNLLSAITKEIEDSGATVIIVSESSERSEWLQVESFVAVGSALSNTRKIVLPVFIGIRRKTPPVLSDIKGLSFTTGTPPETIGVKVREALGRPIFSDTDYLLDSLSLQLKSLRILQEREEVRLRQRTISAIGNSRLIGTIGILLATVSLIIAVALTFQNDFRYSVWFVNSVTVTLTVANVGFVFRFTRKQSRESEAGDDK